jgi:hypothetical protein
VKSVYIAVQTDCLYKADLEMWLKVFIAQYGLILYVKQITFRSVKVHESVMLLRMHVVFRILLTESYKWDCTD